MTDTDVIDVDVVSIEAVDSAVAERKETAETFLERVQAVEIVDQETFVEADTLLATIKRILADTENDRKSFTRPLDDLKKKIMDRYRLSVDMMTRAREIVEAKIKSYYREQERIRLEQERLAQERAEKERIRLEKLAEKAAARGAEERAEEFLTRADEVAMPVVLPTIEKPKGTSISMLWRARLVDADALIRAAAGGDKLAKSLLQFDQVGANKKATALRDTATVPGVEFYVDESIRQRR